MTRTLKRLPTLAAFLLLMQPAGALCQNSYQPTDQSSQSSGHHHHGNHSQQPSPSASGSELRDADDRKLDMLANEYYRVSSKTSHPVEKLKALEGRVKEYHATLNQRTYAGTADLIHDTVNLEHRIEAKRKKMAAWEAQKAAASSPAPAASAPIPTPMPSTATAPVTATPPVPSSEQSH